MKAGGRGRHRDSAVEPAHYESIFPLEKFVLPLKITSNLKGEQGQGIVEISNTSE